jgi:membrane associated rhomboid family serine protease
MVTRELKQHATVLAGAMIVLWALEVVDAIFLGQQMNGLGIHPRSVEGLWGILLAPFLHGGFGHLIANSVPLAVLGWFVMLRRTRDFFYVWFVVTIVGGVGIWLIGHPQSVHIGASIVVFGFLGYLLLRGFFDKSLWSILGSIGVGVLYGGMVWGVLPGQVGISWEGHFFGFTGGILAAWMLRTRAPAKLATTLARRPGRSRSA